MKATGRTLELSVRLGLMCGLLGSFCNAQCERDEPFNCVISQIDMSAGGMAKLAATLARAPYKAHYVRKLIVANPPSGTFLQRMAAIVDDICFDVFYEPVLQLLAGNSLRSVELRSARNLQIFVASGPNDHLERLSVEQSQIDRLPPTLRLLHRLTYFRVMRSRLEVLDLNALASNGGLVYLELSGNRIARILPLTAGDARLPVTEVNLAENLLEYLDMSIWAPFKALQIMNLKNNRLIALDSRESVTLRNLTGMYLDSNRLRTVDFRQLTVPRLQEVTLNDNNLTELPSAWGTKAALKFLSMDDNYISAVDFGALRSLVRLEAIMLSSNRVNNVHGSVPTAHLANLKEIYLQNNFLSRLELNGTDFPSLAFVQLRQNQFTSVPQLLSKYPHVRLSLERNPIKCTNLASVRTQIESFQVVTSYAIGDERCPYAYVRYDGFNYCCVV